MRLSEVAVRCVRGLCGGEVMSNSKNLCSYFMYPCAADRVVAVKALLAVICIRIALTLGTRSAFAQLPAPAFCDTDAQGANDQPGQKDLTQFCIDFGTGIYDLIDRWDWDDNKLPGGNTADACTLFDTDNDGRANLAVCVTTRDGG